MRPLVIDNTTGQTTQLPDGEALEINAAVEANDAVTLQQLESIVPEYIAGTNITIKDNGDGTKTIEAADIELFEVVDELPADGYPNLIYLVVSEGDDGNNIFDEYAWIDEAWEHLGSVSADTDFTDYYMKSEINEQMAAKAALASPAFSGTPTAPTASYPTNSSQLATTAYVSAAFSSGVPQPSNSTPSNIGATQTAGSSSLYSRADHAHYAPTIPTAYSSSATSIGTSGTSGSSTQYSRGDHAHSYTAPTTITGNAATATTLQTSRTIATSGGAVGSATSFNGSANITIPITSIAAAYVTGTLPVTCLATNSTDYTVSRIRNIYAGTTQMTANSTTLESGVIYLCYE